MKRLLFSVLILFASGSYAQYRYFAGCDIGLSPGLQYELKAHGVHTISCTIPEWYNDSLTEEWEFSKTGKLLAFRSYISSTSEADPYPTLPGTVEQSPQDTLYFTASNGTKTARCVNYKYLNSYGIWRRSYYLPDAAAQIGHSDNEMQYAYDGDSNLIYYRSQMDYVAPHSYRALDQLIRYDTLGLVTESIDYRMWICEECPNWFPQFDTVRYERITYDDAGGVAYHTSWTKEEYDADVMYRYYSTGCEHCTHNRGEAETKTESFEAVVPVSPKEQRKTERFYRRHPVMTFSGDRASISGCKCTFSVSYW